jgi:hypothetical protein
MTMKKSQITGQIFIYIFAMVVVGVIALIGFKLFTDWQKKSCDIREISFKQDIKEMMDQYGEYGAVHKDTLDPPCDTKEICLVSASKVNAGDTGGILSDDYGLIADSVADKVEMNTFMVNGKGEIKPLVFVSNMEVSGPNGGFLCVPADRGVKLTFTGGGVTTTVKAGP